MLNRWYDDLALGETETYGGVTVTEAHVVNFASFSGDWNALHMDAEFAAAGPFGARIAHGLLTLVLLNGRVPMAPGRVAALFGLDRVRFPRPVFIGDTVALTMEVTAKHDRGPGGVVTFAQTVRNQSGDAVLKGELKVLMNSSPAQPALAAQPASPA